VVVWGGAANYRSLPDYVMFLFLRYSFTRKVQPGIAVLVWLNTLPRCRFSF
jgi:hypothetical protein